MTDHLARAVELIEQAETIRRDLDLAHAARPKDPTRIHHLAERDRRKLKLAALHIGLADVQATDDLRASVDSLYQALVRPVPVFVPAES